MIVKEIAANALAVVIKGVRSISRHSAHPAFSPMLQPVVFKEIVVMRIATVDADFIVVKLVAHSIVSFAAEITDFPVEIPVISRFWSRVIVGSVTAKAVIFLVKEVRLREFQTTNATGLFVQTPIKRRIGEGGMIVFCVSAQALAVIIKGVTLGGLAYRTVGTMTGVEILGIGVVRDCMLVIKIAADAVAFRIVDVAFCDMQSAQRAKIAVLRGNDGVAAVAFVSVEEVPADAGIIFVEGMRLINVFTAFFADVVVTVRMIEMGDACVNMYLKSASAEAVLFYRMLLKGIVVIAQDAGILVEKIVVLCGCLGKDVFVSAAEAEMIFAELMIFIEA